MIISLNNILFSNSPNIFAVTSSQAQLTCSNALIGKAIGAHCDQFATAIGGYNTSGYTQLFATYAFTGLPSYPNNTILDKVCASNLIWNISTQTCVLSCIAETQTQSASCPVGSTGTIQQSRSQSPTTIPVCTWSSWNTISYSCTPNAGYHCDSQFNCTAYTQSEQSLIDIEDTLAEYAQVIFIIAVSFSFFVGFKTGFIR